MHIEVSEGVSGDLHVLDVDKKKTYRLDSTLEGA